MGSWYGLLIDLSRPASAVYHATTAVAMPNQPPMAKGNLSRCSATTHSSAIVAMCGDCHTSQQCRVTIRLYRNTMLILCQAQLYGKGRSKSRLGQHGDR